MEKPRFQFGNVIVIENNYIGIIVKTWGEKDSYNYDVYVRTSNAIMNFKETAISHFVYSKELAEDEKEFYY